MRARLLLTVGRLRRRLLRLTPAEVAWLPPPPPRPPTPDPAAEAAAAADAAAKGKGKGKTDLAIEPAEAALRANAAARAVRPGPKYVLGLPVGHPVGAAAAALLGALTLSASSRGGHDHALMRDAALELVALLGAAPVPSQRALHVPLAMAFAALAADLASRLKRLLERLPTEVSDEVFATPAGSVPPGTVHELLSLPPSGGITHRTAVALLLALKRDEAADPFGVLGNAKANGAALHAALAHRCALYRDACVLPANHPLLALQPTPNPPYRRRRRRSPAPGSEDGSEGGDDECDDVDDEDDREDGGGGGGGDDGVAFPSADAAAAAPGLEQDVVCLQWRDCDPGEGFDARGGDGDGDGNLRGAVQGFLLLGQTTVELTREGSEGAAGSVGGGSSSNKSTSAGVAPEGSGERPGGPFAATRRLVRVGPLPANASRLLQKRAARFRFALHRAAEDGVAAAPAAVQRGFELLLCDVYRLLFPRANNAHVLRGEARRSDGVPCGAACDLPTLRFVEALLSNKAGGASCPDPHLCAWWRDAADPIAAPVLLLPEGTPARLALDTQAAASAVPAA